MTTVTPNPLTESGMGTILSTAEGTDLAALGSDIREAAQSSGCVLVRGLSFDEQQFQSLVHAVGKTVHHKFGEGQADLLKLNASRDAGKVVTGRGPLPLHTDGMLVGERTDLIMLYAADFQDEPGSGETFVCDQLSAWNEMPKDLRQRLGQADSLEYLVEERGYFSSVPEDWYSIPAVREYGRVRSLNLALNFPDDADIRGWRVRVPNMSLEESSRFLARLDAYLRKPRYTYQHRWRVGDLLVIDNQRTLHGRTAIGTDGTRVLFRGQIAL
ncbi:TauD/TfdA family dioxygenase [Streptomyces antimycoticus]|uniref:TauD/TfdA family dioxygenase n=1 Tax=Streptomyces antimycoticus TaxID=68175 RepID=UPI0034229B62